MFLKRENNEFRMKNVLISCASRMPRICLTAPFESSKRKAIAEFNEYTKYLDSLNLKNPKVVAMIENTFFIIGREYLGSSTAGSHYHGANHLRNVVITSENGHTICSNESCKDYDIVALRPGNHDLRTGGASIILVHEFLHGAWHSILPEESRRSFLETIRMIFNIGGNAKETDDFFMSLYSSKGELSFYGGFTLGLDFVEHNFPSMSAKEKADLGLTAAWYFQFRMLFVAGASFYQKDEGLSKDQFIKFEGYPVAFVYGNGFLNEFYAPVISEKGFYEQQIGYKSDHLSSRENFKKVVPLLETFYRYLRSRPPEYWDEMKKINTQEDAVRYLRRYEPGTS
jgi:hypothetical protein